MGRLKDAKSNMVIEEEIMYMQGYICECIGQSNGCVVAITQSERGNTAVHIQSFSNRFKFPSLYFSP